MCKSGLHDVTLPGATRGGRCVECLRAKGRRAQDRYSRTPKGRMALQRYRLTAKSERVRFYETLRQVAARHARAHEELR